MRVFSFFVDDELFAVDVSRVEKVVRKIPITHIPAAPDVIKGIINLKGRVITIFNLCKLLGQKNKQNSQIPFTDRRKSAGLNLIDNSLITNKTENEADKVNIVIFKSFFGSEDQMGLVMDRPDILINIDDNLIRQPSLATGAEESYCICGIAELNDTLYRIIDIDSIKDKYTNNAEKNSENISNGGIYGN